MNIKSNIRKFFIFKLSHGSYYFVILWIYFLMFPWNSIWQLWIFATVSYITSFLLEIPSSYMADRRWHKETLIISKIVKALSTICFLLSWNFWVFMIWHILWSSGYAFASGTDSAFMHETLTSLGKEKQYTKIMSRINGNISLVSIAIIALLPLLSKIDIRLPFLAWLIIDIVWLIVSFLFVRPKNEEIVKKSESPLKIIKSFRWKNFFWIALLPAIIMGFVSSESNFRWPFLQNLGYPIAYIGFVLATSKVIVRWVWRIAHKIKENISIKRLFTFEVIFFSTVLFLLALIKQPYINAILIAIMIWYLRWRKDLLDHICLELIDNKAYTATALSFVSQLWSVIQLFIALIVGFLMSISYSIGFVFLWMWVIIWWIFRFRKIKNKDIL